MTFLKANAGHIIGAILVVLVAGLLFHSWIGEHDARLVAEGKIATAQTTIDGLQKNQASTTAAAKTRVVVLQREAAAVKTPTEALAALKADTVAAPLEVSAGPEGEVTVDGLALYKGVNDYEQATVNLAACTSNLSDETKIASAKDDEIKALKAKPAFWHRVKDTAITVGIGVAVGYAAHR